VLCRSVLLTTIIRDYSLDIRILLLAVGFTKQCNIFLGLLPVITSFQVYFSNLCSVPQSSMWPVGFKFPRNEHLCIRLPSDAMPPASPVATKFIQLPCQCLLTNTNHETSSSRCLSQSPVTPFLSLPHDLFGLHSHTVHTAHTHVPLPSQHSYIQDNPNFSSFQFAGVLLNICFWLVFPVN
jgi:hypothetical protein